MLLKAALDQPAIEHAIQPIRVLETQASILGEESEGELPTFHQKGTELEEKLQELQTCEIMIQSNGSELVELISRDLGSGTISKATLDRLVLFKMTANAMVEASLGFTSAANKEHEKILKKTEKQKEWWKNKKKELGISTKNTNGRNLQKIESTVTSLKLKLI